MRNEIKRYLADKNKHLASINRLQHCDKQDLMTCCDCCLLTEIVGDPVNAQQLLEQHRGLKGLFDHLLNQTSYSAFNSGSASESPVSETRGMRIIQLMMVLYRRYLYAQVTDKTQLISPDATRDFLKAELYAKQSEVFAALFLDNAHRVIVYEELFVGTINGASVYPRVVLQKALTYNAAAIILAHNHPSGVAEPSEADKSITKILVNLLQQVDIRILDHLVVGEGEMVSFAERGLL